MKKSKNSSFFYLIKNLWQILPNKRRFNLIILLLSMILNAFLEVLSIASIIPFLSLLLNPEEIYSYKYINIFKNLFKFSNNNNLLIYISITLFLIIIITTITRLINLRFSNFISAKIGIYLSLKIFDININNNYISQKSRNSSDLINTNTFRIEQTILVINSILAMFSSLLISLCIFLSLIYINLKVSIATFIIYSSCYYFLAVKNKRKLSQNSRIISKTSSDEVKIIQESFGSMKDILLNNAYTYYFDLFKINVSKLRLKQAENAFLSSYPKYPLESIGILLICFIGISLSINKSINVEIITILSVFALGAQKLLPSIQSIYFNWSSLKARTSDVEKVINFLLNNCNRKEKNIFIKRYNFQKKIVLRNISFSYSKYQEPILKNINLKINRGEKIGFVGKTGSGKSTLLDIIMGLIEPTSGSILIDNIDLYKEGDIFLNSWRNTLSYVPQNIYLLDQSFLENIAFGIKKEAIDNERVFKCAIKANIHDLILSSKDGYLTKIGERGIKLSGGQIQRIALARAFYKKSDILFLDEATSALDNNTENLIMHQINNLSDQKTIIMIAHRISSLKDCDKIYKLENKTLKEINTNQLNL